MPFLQDPAAAPGRGRRRAPCAGRSRACAARRRTTSRRRCRSAASSSATPAKLPKSAVLKAIVRPATRRRAGPSSCTSAIGRSGSTDRITAAMLCCSARRIALRPHRHHRAAATGSARTARRSPGTRRPSVRRCGRRCRRRRSATRSAARASSRRESAARRRCRCVSGSTPGRYFFTNVSLTMATGTPAARSCSVNARPRVDRGCRRSCSTPASPC